MSNSDYNRYDIELSVSSAKLHHCDDIIKHMCHSGIMTSVTQNTTVICNHDTHVCWLETGCRLLIPNISKHSLQHLVWDPLQKSFHFHCAHVHVNGIYSGCILDYLRTSSCTGPLQ